MHTHTHTQYIGISLLKLLDYLLIYHYQSLLYNNQPSLDSIYVKLARSHYSLIPYLAIGLISDHNCTLLATLF